MGKSIYYGGGRDVQLESFGVTRPAPVDSRESLAVSGGLDRLSALAGQRDQQQQVADFAEQGAKVSLQKDADGSLKPVELYNNDTVAGRAFNQSALMAAQASIGLDADAFAKETVSKIENDREKLPDGTLGPRISKDMVGDFSAQWGAYVNKTLGRQPDAIRAAMQDRLISAGRQYANGLQVKQQEEAVQRQTGDMLSAFQSLANDAISIRSTDMQASTRLATDAIAIIDQIPAFAGSRVDAAKIAGLRTAFAENLLFSDVKKEALDLFNAENAKGRNLESTATAKVRDFLSKQGLPEEIIKGTMAIVDVQSREASAVRAEADSLATQRFSVEQSAFILDMQRIAESKGNEAARVYAAEQAKKAVTPGIRAFWENSANGYAVRQGNDVPIDQAITRAEVLASYSAGRDPRLNLEADMAKLGISAKSDVGQAFLERAVANHEDFRRRVIAADLPYNQAVGSIAKRVQPDGRILNPNVDATTLDKDMDTVYKSSTPTPGVPSTPKQDFRLTSSPEVFSSFFARTKNVSPAMANDVFSFIANGKGESLDKIKSVHTVIGTLLNADGAEYRKINIEKDPAAYGQLRQWYDEIGSALNRLDPAEFAHLPKERQGEEMAKRRQQVMQDVRNAFDQTAEVMNVDPEVRKQRIAINTDRLLGSQSIVDDWAQYAINEAGRGRNEDQMVRSFGADASGIRIGGNNIIFRNQLPIQTIRAGTFLGNEIEHYFGTSVLLNAPIVGVQAIGRVAEFLGAPQGTADRYGNFVSNIFQRENVFMPEPAMSAFRAASRAALSEANINPSEVPRQVVERMSARGWQASQFHPEARKGNAAMMEKPPEWAYGGFQVAAVGMANFLREQGDLPNMKVSDMIEAVFSQRVTAEYRGDIPVNGKMAHRYTVKIQKTDGSEFIVESPLLVPADFKSGMERAGQDAAKAKAIELRTARQAGAPIVTPPSMSDDEFAAASARGNSLSPGRALPPSVQSSVIGRAAIDAESAAIAAAAMSARFDWAVRNASPDTMGFDRRDDTGRGNVPRAPYPGATR